MKDDIFSNFFLAIFLVIVLGIFFAVTIDKTIQNQDTMLCESAKVSGNVQYLHKCECYYQTEDIKCLQK